MSIEADIKRIADGVEDILKILGSVNKVQMVAEQAAPKQEPSVISTRQPIPDDSVVDKLPEPTEEEVRNAVRKIMAEKGKDVAVGLVVKHGGDPVKPMIKDIKDRKAFMKEAANV